ncbi:MAG: glucosaminidase domain-containing protein [Microthrixaceae bacterium]
MQPMPTLRRGRLAAGAARRPRRSGRRHAGSRRRRLLRRKDAAAELERAHARKSSLAVESYTLALSGSSPELAASSDLMADTDSYERFVRTTEYSGAAWRSLGQGVERAEGFWPTPRRQRRRRSATSRSCSVRSVPLGPSSTPPSRTPRGSPPREEAIATAAATGDDLSVDGLGPTILGETLLSAEDLAAFSARRTGAAPSIDLLELARLFVFEGAAEGVRGDIAWAQSILETGNFGYKGSMVSTSDNNYAGIGACDSCSSGFTYGTPQLGVRAQMQLLHTYANDNLTSADLAFPPAGRPPERSSVRGCCDTWMELSGVWATGPGYGVKILTIYNEMLAFAAQRHARHRRSPPRHAGRPRTGTGGRPGP